MMKTGNAVRIIMLSKQVGVNQLAKQLGKSSRLVSERLAQENISVKKLNELLQLMDYKIMIVPKDYQVGENTFEIE